MSKFDRVLSDAELISATFKADVEGTMGELRAVEQAVLAKLAEQEPMASVSSESFSSDGTSDIMSKNLKIGTKLYTHPIPCVSPTSDKPGCVSENAESDTQEPVAWRIKAKKFCGTLTSSPHVAQHWLETEPESVTPLYAAPQPTNSAQIHRNLIKSLALKNGFTLKGEDLHEYVYNFANELASVVADATLFDKSTKNHIADGGKMVFDSDFALTLAERTLSVEITEILADELIQFARKLHEKYAQTDHIPDSGKMITPLAQRKIQTLLDKGEYRVIENATVLVNENGHAAIVNHGGAFYWVDNDGLAREFVAAGAGVDSDHIADIRKKVPEGWQLIPKEPTEQMRVKGGSTAIQTGGTWGCVAIEVYKAMLAAAPKYTGEK